MIHTPDSLARHLPDPAFVDNHGPRCWEIDAMNPNDLRDRVEGKILTYIDPVLWNRSRDVEAAEVQSMQDFHKAWRGRLTAKED